MEFRKEYIGFTRVHSSVKRFRMRDEKNSAVNYLPSLLVVGVALASWKLLGGPEYIDGLSSKDLLEEYDYVIGKRSTNDE